MTGGKMIYRIYSEKFPELANEAKTLRQELFRFLQIKGIDDLRILNRYDVEDIDEELFNRAKTTVFSEPQQDYIYDSLPVDTEAFVFAVEFLPGQFDQRADSAAQCIQLISQKDKPAVRTAKVYMIRGEISDEEKEAIKHYVINPVEAREASLELPDTLEMEYAVPTEVETVTGFTDMNGEELSEFIKKLGLAMDEGDIAFCQAYFRKEGRDPTITEIRMIDTYWSDHCRHTTFLTTIDDIRFEDEEIRKTYEEYLSVREELGIRKPVNLMDMGTIAAKYLKRKGLLDKLDESEEINACTVKINIEVNRRREDWLLLFKNETHNHPTEIEPFGGAATCIGGAIRDPLSGRSYVYAAMRITGASDPLQPVEKTIKGKLPQRKIVTTAAAGYSSYGNQIGLATGIVDELYHEGYTAKHMEIGAVLGAAPARNVRREVPLPGDVVILLGGRTGRDGIGGATGSSKSHTTQSLESCGAEVQKGNAPEERKLQRLFRNPEASRLIKRCNDFGAGGVSVAIGELADGLYIDLNAVPKKYEGLDGTELAISESQERMAVVVAPEDEMRFRELAFSENLEATKVAVVTEEPRLVMKWNGKAIVDISREFLNSNGAEKHIEVEVPSGQGLRREVKGRFDEAMAMMAGDLNICSKRGLSERFDSTIGAGTVLMPFGGSKQLTPIQTMIHKIPVENGDTDAVSFMSWGYNPYVMERSPYHGAYLSVVESVSKLIAAGADFKDIYLTFQEYFEKPMRDPKRWGKPAAALLGAFRAQMDLGIAAIGGKDSMSGTFENIDVPPTLVSFAVTTGTTEDVITNHFKKNGHKAVLLQPRYDANGLPKTESLKELYEKVTELIRNKKVFAVQTLTYGGIAEAIMKMSFGEGFGFDFAKEFSLRQLFDLKYGAFIVEAEENLEGGAVVGTITNKKEFSYGDEYINTDLLQAIYEDRLESVYKLKTLQGLGAENVSAPAPETEYKAEYHVSRPRVLIPVFPGTNCEYDTKKAWEKAGADATVFVINNLTPEGISASVKGFAELIRQSQIIFIPGGFSGGDEPDGSGKFITAFFRNPEIKEAVQELLEKRDGLMGGICNGFQALIKLGLVPYGKILDTDISFPTLTFNSIGRHQSRLVRTRVASVRSPWLTKVNVGDVFTVPVSHGEGRFIASDEVLAELVKNGQVMTQYVDPAGNATMDIRFNPNGSMCAIEGILSGDGRVFGKMGHSERTGNGLYQNVDGSYDMKLFESAVKYYNR